MLTFFNVDYNNSLNQLKPTPPYDNNSNDLQNVNIQIINHRTLKWYEACHTF